jgi:xanthine/CO dehydrogenase XdhC/CoxF family maturation factor
MAQLTPNWQKFVDCPDNVKIGITKVTIQTASDTVVVPRLANYATGNLSAKQLVRNMPADDTGITVTDSAATDDTNVESTVTLTSGTKGKSAVIVSIHDGARDVNSSSLTVT